MNSASSAAIAAIAKRIRESKKYRAVHPKMVHRIVAACARSGTEADVEQCSRTLLHQAWGAYFDRRPNFAKLLHAFEYPLESGYSQEENLKRILALHASTRERLPFLNEFYGQIFEHTGKPSSVIDHGCGLHPLALPWMGLAPDATYTGYDIDTEAIPFLNRVLSLVAPNARATVAAGDLLVDRFPEAEVALFLKLLPVIEHEQKKSSLRVLKKQRCKHLVVSFPRESIGESEKGMTEFYGRWFEELIESEHWAYEHISFPTELVYVVRKG